MTDVIQSVTQPLVTPIPPSNVHQRFALFRAEPTLEYFCGNPSNNGVRFDIFGHHRSSADDRSGADGHSSLHGDPVPNPYIMADGNGVGSPLIEALKRGQAPSAFRAEHLLHLRCEISDPDTPALTADALTHPLAKLVSVMDHTPGDCQSPNIERWFNHMIHEMEISAAEGRAQMDELFERSVRIGAENRAKIIAHAKAAGVPS